MCGFSGCLLTDSANPIRFASGMLFAHKHRGPDAEGYWAEENILLTHNRLSILDLSATANQPFHSRDRRYVLAYNGEIYNFQELREELQARGLIFHTHSDTEVLVEAIATWGTDAISRLNGMFAFACWDRTERRLILARDRFGIKPLHITQTDEGLFFGSEIKALLSTQAFEKRIDVQGLAEFMWFGNALGGNTLFAGVTEVLPGEVRIFSNGFETIKQYWHPSQIKESAKHFPNPEVHVRELLEAAVSRQLVSDVPIGIFLSGGIDSSAITSFAVKHSPSQICTYSVEFDYALGASELTKAAQVAKHFGTRHHEVRIQANDLPTTIENLIRAHDQPFSDAANIPLFLLTRELRGDLKVVLQGDGGDEIFGGYRRYQTLRHIRALGVLARKLAPFFQYLPRRTIVDRIRRYCNALKPTNRAHIMALLLTVEDATTSPLRVFTHEFRESLSSKNPFRRYEEIEGLIADRDAVQAMLYVDTSIVLPDIFLEKVDRSTMANSMEIRVPFLDNDLVDFALSLSAQQKLAGGTPKGLLKKALAGVIPQEILGAPKVGFGVPYAAWLRGPLKKHLNNILLDRRARVASILEPHVVTELIDQHLQGIRDHSFLLWKLMQLAMWMEEYKVDCV